MNKERGIYCSCVEGKLPVMKRPTKRAEYRTDPDRHGDNYNEDVIIALLDGYNNIPLDVRDILIKLKTAGLDQYERKLIWYIVIEEWTAKQMLSKGWVSVDSVSYHYRKALRKLREAGFSR